MAREYPLAASDWNRSTNSPFFCEMTGSPPGSAYPGQRHELVGNLLHCLRSIARRTPAVRDADAGPERRM